ncbi:MAG: TrkA family potassium uptake protein [Bacteroidetes bacterium]|jgi:voltage-gated potassium channel|nr:TrkA family potassium uptake protein [Bacteroidota bacterium]
MPRKLVRRITIYSGFIILFLVVLRIIVYFEAPHESSSIKTIWDAIWYSIVTLSTVGYGDQYPVTPQGKILGLFLVISSLGLVGYLIGNISNEIRNYMEKKKEGFYGTDFRNHFVVIGWNNFGRMVVNQIVSAGNDVAIVTNSKADLDVIKDLYENQQVFVLYTEFTNYDAYQKVNIKQARSVFINRQDDSEALVFLINMRKHFNTADFVVSLDNAELKETFQSIGAKYVLARNEIASRLVASYIFEPDVGTFTEDLIATSVNETDFDIQQYRVTQSNPFVNNDYLEVFMELKKMHDSVLLGLVKIDEKGNRQLLKNPAKGTRVAMNDYLLVISNGVNKKNLEKTFGVSEGLLMGAKQ